MSPLRLNKYEQLSVFEFDRLAAIAHSKTVIAERLVALSQKLESASRDKIAKSDQVLLETSNWASGYQPTKRVSK